jgi:hypothetical protein
MTAQGMALFIHILAGFGLLFAEWGPSAAWHVSWGVPTGPCRSLP